MHLRGDDKCQRGCNTGNSYEKGKMVHGIII